LRGVFVLVYRFALFLGRGSSLAPNLSNGFLYSLVRKAGNGRGGKWGGKRIIVLVYRFAFFLGRGNRVGGGRRLHFRDGVSLTGREPPPHPKRSTKCGISGSSAGGIG